VIDDTVRALIAHHRLTPLPIEGTLYRGTWRSPQPGAGTAMVGLYCDEPPSHSLFHRLPVDEVWHFYGGGPLRLVLLHPDGRDEDVILGSDFAAGQHVQFVVPAHSWQAGHLLPGARYALFGCTLAPGFTSAMFEGGTRDRLLQSHPQRATDIERLACDATTMPPLAGEAGSLQALAAEPALPGRER
jgi:predicted cupin superfamily sugar epimerase